MESTRCNVASRSYNILCIKYLSFFLISSNAFTTILQIMYVMVSEVHATLISCSVHVGKSIEMSYRSSLILPSFRYVVFLQRSYLFVDKTGIGFQAIRNPGAFHLPILSFFNNVPLSSFKFLECQFLPYLLFRMSILALSPFFEKMFRKQTSLFLRVFLYKIKIYKENVYLFQMELQEKYF